MHSVLHTCVRISDLVRVAAPASVAMEVVLAATNTAYSALGAMEYQFLNAVIIPEFAILAEVGPKDLPARNAILSWRLSCRTLLADHFRDLCSVNFVGVNPTGILDLIVTVTAPEGLPAAWGNDAAA